MVATKSLLSISFLAGQKTDFGNRFYLEEKQLCAVKIMLLMVWVLLFLCTNVQKSVGQTPARLFNHLEWLDAQKVKANPNLSLHKLAIVYNQLQKQTRKKYPVFLAQTNKLGIARAGGSIVFDLSVLAKPVEIVAFWLAHEWAHLDLGHAPNAQSPLSATYAAFVRRQYIPTSSEDEADAYATRFLVRHGYPVKAILQYMCALPAGASGMRHRATYQRANHIAALFRHLTGRKEIVPCAPGFKSGKRYRFRESFLFK